METPISHSCEKKKGTRSHIYHYLRSISFHQTPRTSHPFFHLYTRPSFSPQSLPFCQPCLCHHRSLDKREAQRSRRQQQPTSPAPKHGPWQEHSSIPGPSSRGCSSLLLGSKDHPLVQKLFWSSFLFPRMRDPSPEMQGMGSSPTVLAGKSECICPFVWR